MRKRILYWLFMLLGTFLILTGCGSTPIGDVLTLTATVEVGPSDALVVIDDSTTLLSGQSVRVSGGHGRARLTLVDGTVIIELYDSTDSDFSSTAVSGSAAAMAYLSQGGLTASVNEGSTCTVNVPNGGTFYILGTEAFIIYNPQTQFATAGNFKGTVKWDSADAKGQTLEPGTMVDIGPGGQSFPPYPMPFGIEEFDRIVTEVGSPIETVTILRDLYNIPQSGRSFQPPFQEQSLFTFEGGNMVPGIASDWTVEESAASGTETWTFFLRRDLRLENGEPLTAPFVTKVIFEKTSPEARSGVEIFPADDFTLVIRFFKGSDRSLLEEIPAIKFIVQQ
jgi:hypothetical protein